jgi:hypothetical protein
VAAVIFRNLIAAWLPVMADDDWRLVLPSKSRCCVVLTAFANMQVCVRWTTSQPTIYTTKREQLATCRKQLQLAIE